jgi:hypothetical protein
MTRDHSDYIEVTEGPFKGIHLGLKDDGQKIPLSLFMTVNSDVLTVFQTALIPLILSVDHNKQDLQAAAVLLRDQIARLEACNFKPTVTSGDKVNLPQHYKVFPIEPTLYCQENGIDWLRSNILKYVCRYPWKNGIEDLRKTLRCLEMYARYVLGEEAWNK